MALIKCPECNKDVSDSAPVCPHCGYVLKRTPPATQYHESRSSRLYEREYTRKYMGCVVAGIICLISGPLFLIFLKYVPSYDYQLKGTVIGSSIGLIIGGIILLVVGILRLKEWLVQSIISFKIITSIYTLPGGGVFITERVNNFLIKT